MRLKRNTGNEAFKSLWKLPDQLAMPIGIVFTLLIASFNALSQVSLKTHDHKILRAKIFGEANGETGISSASTRADNPFRFLPNLNGSPWDESAGPENGCEQVEASCYRFRKYARVFGDVFVSEMIRATEDGYHITQQYKWNVKMDRFLNLLAERGLAEVNLEQFPLRIQNRLRYEAVYRVEFTSKSLPEANHFVTPWDHIEGPIKGRWQESLLYSTNVAVTVYPVWFASARLEAGVSSLINKDMEIDGDRIKQSIQTSNSQEVTISLGLEIFNLVRFTVFAQTLRRSEVNGKWWEWERSDAIDLFHNPQAHQDQFGMIAFGRESQSENLQSGRFLFWRWQTYHKWTERFENGDLVARESQWMHTETKRNWFGALLDGFEFAQFLSPLADRGDRKRDTQSIVIGRDSVMLEERLFGPKLWGHFSGAPRRRLRHRLRDYGFGDLNGHHLFPKSYELIRTTQITHDQLHDLKNLEDGELGYRMAKICGERRPHRWRNARKRRRYLRRWAFGRRRCTKTLYQIKNIDLQNHHSLLGWARNLWGVRKPVSRHINVENEEILLRKTSAMGIVYTDKLQ